MHSQSPSQKLSSMSHKLNVIYWVPRVLSVLVIVFFSIFALDVFIPGKTIGYYMEGLIIHLLPNLILAVLLAIAWKWEKIGGLLFMAAAILTVFIFDTYIAFPNFFFISFPIFVIGGLFVVHDYFLKRRTYE